MWRFKTTPKPHQIQYLELFANKESCMIWADMRSGKTKMIIDNACHLYNKKLIDVVVFSCREEWVQSIFKKDIQHYVHGWDGIKSKYQFLEKKTLKKINIEQDTLNYIGVSHDFARSKETFAFLTTILKNHRVFFVLDEGHLFTDANSTRGKAINKMMKLAKYKRLLTGTPIETGVENLWASFNALDEKILKYKYKNYTKFTEEICNFQKIKLNMFKEVSQIVGYKQGQCTELFKHLAPHIYRYKLTDDVKPPVTQKIIKYDLTIPQLTELAQCESHQVRQICSGFMYDNEEDKTYHEFNDNPVAVKIGELFKTLNKKIVVWYNLSAQRQILSERLLSYSKLFVDNVEDFENWNSPCILILNARIYGCAITIKTADTLVWFDIPDYGIFRQANERCTELDKMYKEIFIYILQNEKYLEITNTNKAAYKLKKYAKMDIIIDSFSYEILKVQNGN